jgi:hypothetical protein
LGAEEKRRLTAGDDRVRDSHFEDSEVGWISINEEYPYSHEQFAGEIDINCRCTDEYRFKKAE